MTTKPNVNIDVQILIVAKEKFLGLNVNAKRTMFVIGKDTKFQHVLR